MTAPSAEPTVRWFELPNAPNPGTFLAKLHDLEDNRVTLLSLPVTTHPADKPYALLLLRSGAAVHAFVNRCPHFGVPLAARQEHLIQKPGQSLSCNVHYARFRWRDGLCESGDCQGESLIAIPLVVTADGSIHIEGPPTP